MVPELGMTEVPFSPGSLPRCLPFAVSTLVPNAPGVEPIVEIPVTAPRSGAGTRRAAETAPSEEPVAAASAVAATPAGTRAVI